MKRLLMVLCAFMPIVMSAQENDAALITRAAADNRVMEHLDVIVNRFGGRPIGSDAFRHATRWSAEEFRSWGYDVAWERAGETAVGFNRDHWQGRMIAPDTIPLHFATPSYTVGTRGIQRGRVVLEPRTLTALDSLGNSLTGAWVMLDEKGRGWPVDRSEKGETARRKAIDDGTSARAIYYREMVERGVAGFIHSTAVPITALYDAETVWHGSFDNLPSACEILLDEAQYEAIRPMVEAGEEVWAEFDIRNHFIPDAVEFHNVTATVRGSEFPDEYVVVGAHLDSYDVATGSVDDGNGTAVVMEAARILAASGVQLKRSVIFILFAGEEFGLLGSIAWTQQHADLLPRISNMFNRDGGPMPYVGIRLPEYLIDDYASAAATVEELYPDYGFRIDTLETRPAPTARGGNDATTFAVEGVPTLRLSERDIKNYGFDYREIWHTECDTYNKVYPDYLHQAATVLALMICTTANLSAPIDRTTVYSDAPAHSIGNIVRLATR